jgi:SAM-dependent methyltransferase
MDNFSFSNWKKYSSYVNPQNGESFDDGHLGGCNIYGDPALELPKTWKFLIDEFNVKSVIDVGCGFGFHTKYFRDILNCDVLGVEGSEKVVDASLIPENVICHDYTKGPFVPEKLFDMCWSVEFVEHVDEQYSQNFLETFKRSKYVVMTHGVPGQSGHHHVNCRDSNYWIDRMKDSNFELMPEMTENCRRISTIDKKDYLAWQQDSSENKKFRGFSANARAHLVNSQYDFFFERNGLVFKNLKF